MGQVGLRFLNLRSGGWFGLLEWGQGEVVIGVKEQKNLVGIGKRPGELERQGLHEKYWGQETLQSPLDH